MIQRKLNTFLILLSLFFASYSCFGQMVINNDTLYGNEWIDYDKSYYKIKVAEDGVYKIDMDVLIAAGLPLSSINGADFKMFAFGEEVAIYTSTEGTMGLEDYIEFYGQKNRGELDAHLYAYPETMQLNPDYSMYNDTMTYFLTWERETLHERIVDIEIDLTNNILEPEPYYMAEEKLVFSDVYNKPIKPSHTAYSHFDTGEGFGSSSFKKRTFTLDVNNIFQGLRQPILKLRTGANINNHIRTISFNEKLLATRNYNGFVVQDYDLPFNLEDLKETNDIEIAGISNIGDQIDRAVVAMISITYPRHFIAEYDSLFAFTLEQSDVDKYIEIKMPSLKVGSYIIYNLTKKQRIIGDVVDATNIVRFMLEAGTLDQNIVLFHESSIKDIQKVAQKTFVNIENLDVSYLVLTSERLRNDSLNGIDRPQEYADFRSSELGGGYTTTVVNIEDLYDQFSYGIDRHSISIRNFGQYMSKHWTDFKYVFIIGKGLDLSIIRNNEDLQEVNHLFFVPTFGRIPSDNLLFSKPEEIVPSVAIGRLAARNPQQIADYLDKAIAHAEVNQYETHIANNAWTKKVIHLGGGEAADRIIIKKDLEKLRGDIEQSEFGAHVTSYYKQSSEAISTSISEDIIDDINGGVSIITFFGHSAVGSLDYSIGRAEFYDNKDKYPVFLSLGCLSGNIHTKGVEGISENYVLTKDKGSVAFIASSFTAYIPTLYSLTSNFYTKIGNSGSDFTLGEGLLFAMSELKYGGYSYEILIEQLTLHGDPAIVIQAKNSADFTPDYSSLSLQPNIVNAALDSFQFSIDIFNIGRANVDSIFVGWKHIGPEGDTLFENKNRILAPKFRENYSFTIPLNSNNILGENIIHFEVDSKEEVDEVPKPLAEDNNLLQNENAVQGYSFFIIDNNLMPVYPKEFGIVSDKQLELLASSSNVFLEEQKYLLQIDTSELFNSLLDQTTIIQGGGLLSWKPNINFENERVYYWRVSPDSTDVNVGYVWNNSSFVYLDNSNEGWNQSHYYQLKKDIYKDLNILSNQNFEFGINFLDIKLKNAFSNAIHKIEVFISNIKALDLMNHQSAPCIIVAAVDTLGGFLWNGPQGDYGAFNPTTGEAWEQPLRGFYYHTNTYEDRQNLVHFLEDVIPDNHYVFFYTDVKINLNDLGIEDWENDTTFVDGKSLFNVLEEQGAARIRELKTKGGVPYNLIYQKGYSQLSEVVFEEADEFIESNTQIKGRWHEGTIKTEEIGPASKWHNIVWNETLSPNPENDTTFINVYALDSEKEIVDTIYYNVISKSLNINHIDAALYPYIKLEYFAKDIVDKTPATFNYWRVYYDRVAELVLNPTLKSYFHADSIYQGDILKYDVMVSNITNQDVDSLLVKYTITNSDNQAFISYIKNKPVKANTNEELSYNFDTRILNDDFTLNIEVNPDNDQIEQYHFNNIGLKRVVLLKDIENPLLNVLFDGIRIMDEDIVSPLPLIRIELKDNSPFMLIEDIEQFSVELIYPDDHHEIINLSESDDIIFFPAKDSDNHAYIEFRPTFVIEGIYSLLVQAKDASGNFSGDNEFQVRFNVILGQKVTNLINYPNPFSTSTQFIFSLSGAALPSSFKIQIMSTSGKVVKEITEEAFGFLHIGVNKSEYLWNGTDDYGEKLANGVYFYKVSMKNAEGENYEHINTSIDKYFHKGWGKLVIIR